VFYWVLYDISEDKKRNKVAKLCKNYGLRRVQKSAFAGEITPNKLEMLEIECKEILEETDDYLFVLPSCASCFNSKRITTGFIDEKKLLNRGYAFTGESG